MTFVFMSTFAFASCYTDMVTAFEQNNQNFRDALAGAAANAGFECISAIEGMGANPTPFGAALTVGLLLNAACESDSNIKGISDQFDPVYEQIGLDYCMCETQGAGPC